ncbi:hypothetical protein IG631_17881 [Alternaria alternata]|nr:hypothetical protein IG631_17881 [Alternaria alternata]
MHVRHTLTSHLHLCRCPTLGGHRMTDSEGRRTRVVKRMLSIPRIWGLGTNSTRVVIALTAEGRAPTRFTDYERPGEHSNFYNEVKIWEVARATSAATSFFAPMEITHAGEPRRFLDAGIGSNNPINELYLEAMSQFDKSEEEFDKQIRVLVSIGTGRPALHGFGEKVTEVAKSIASIATETQDTANTFHLTHRKLANRGGYFRFNPPDLSEVAIDESSKKGIIASRTDTYGNDAHTLEMVERWVAVAGFEKSASTLIESIQMIDFT